MTIETSAPPAQAAPRLALTSSASAEWGTPSVVQSCAAAVLAPASQIAGCPINLDAMSSAYWQDHWPMGATPGAYFDGTQPTRDLFDGAAFIAGGMIGVPPFTAFCNPAGDTSGETVQRAWEVLTCAHRERAISSLFWVGFSLEQLASLQNAGDVTPLDPERACTIIPSRRIRYRVHPQRALDGLVSRFARKVNMSEAQAVEHLTSTRGLDSFVPNHRATVREVRALYAQINRGDLSPVSGDAPTHASYLTIMWDHRVKIRQKQQSALRRFLAAEAKDPKSVLHKCSVVGRFAT